MKSAGVVIIILGILMVLFTGFDYVTKKKVIDVGSVEVTQDKEHEVSWSPIAGGIMILVGGAMLIFGNKKS